MSLHCPRCLSKDVRRAKHSGFLAAILAHFGLHPYRCRNCRKRFFRSGECVTPWDVDGPAPVLATPPANRPVNEPRGAIEQPQPWGMDRDARTDARSSLAVRKRDWVQLLQRGRVA